ncbi:2-dehydro-3-deoxygalactonokinase [Xenorhabdus poinarii G6]|uniref:2-dehydro-3-deoxygalactonokinase n=1 Tax=Xenorhabdus poinarii G6 TaxID=1354304 RepID=A0A068R4K4_9GAMM|nr:2-dehydro-3-deoxygalactonokinase [Xenorhabdus poinarii]CDG21826.1 2-dehydro-3-deoxygalactonokinase [Xenorhabdus poinarii G6]
MKGDYIAIDWGSTNLRAWLYRDGVATEYRHSASGITRLGNQTPQQVFDDITRGWRDSGNPVVMAGMVGSNAGWISVPYLSCPTRLDDLAIHLTPVDDAVWIVPGLSVNRDGNCNVMRGEETQLLGAWREMPASVFIMPGTHSKWVLMKGDSVQDFRTVMTGELHYLLMNHSLIGSGLPKQIPDESAFTRGLHLGLNDAAVLVRLFEVRAAHVLGKLPREYVSDWLSGILIGAEVAEMKSLYDNGVTDKATVIANPELAKRYVIALKQAGIPSEVMEGEYAFQTGIRSIIHELAR